MPRDHVDACCAKMAGQASDRQVLAAKPSELRTFERRFFNHRILALDHHFIRPGGQGRHSAQRGEMLCDAIVENDGRMSASRTIRYKSKPRS